MKKPQLEDFYDDMDPRGCSTSEFDAYEKALKNWEYWQARPMELEQMQDFIAKGKTRH